MHRRRKPPRTPKRMKQMQNLQPKNGTCVRCSDLTRCRIRVTSVREQPRKHHVHISETSSILVTCPKGMPEYLEAELKGLGFKETFLLDAGVQVKGTLTDCMRLNLWVRTGHRVLFEMKRFDASALTSCMPQSTPFRGKTISNGTDISGWTPPSATPRSTTPGLLPCASRMLWPTVFGQVRQSSRLRPGDPRQLPVPALAGPQRHHVSGHHRGTAAPARLPQAPAFRPHAGTLGAACILAAGWPKIAEQGGHFIVPMCGSGTLAIEAALMAMNGAPGLLRDNFAFMHIPGYDPAVWDDLIDAAEDAETRTFPAASSPPTMTRQPLKPPSTRPHCRSRRLHRIRHL